MGRRVVFFSPMCLFDHRSGAALSVRTHMETLAAHGWEVETVTGAVCDGPEEYPKQCLLGYEGARTIHRGKCIRRVEAKVTHNILHTRSTVVSQLGSDEQALLRRILAKTLETPTDMAVTYGGSGFSQALQSLARPRVGKMVFYLANASYNDAALFRHMDAVICPSRYLRDFYAEKLGIQAHVLQDTIDEAFFCPPGNKNAGGFVTYINPSPAKGALLFIRLAHMALERRPEITFLAVEGRMPRKAWQDRGLDPALLPNVFWLPNQSDMSRVYRFTRILLFPTFWKEAAGRCVVEAQLSGIPVLASDRGGVPAQLNGGGFCLPNPPGCEKDHSRMPTENETQPWLDILCRLSDDHQAYEDAVRLALDSSAPFHPEVTRPRALAFFKTLLQNRSGGK